MSADVAFHKVVEDDNESADIIELVKPEQAQKDNVGVLGSFHGVASISMLFYLKRQARNRKR